MPSLKMRGRLEPLIIKMSIDTSEHLPITKKPYALALKHYDWVRDEIDKLFNTGVIRESHSSWSAPIVVVPKGDGGTRFKIWLSPHIPG